MFKVSKLNYNPDLNINSYIEDSYINNKIYTDSNIIKKFDKTLIDYNKVENKNLSYTTKYWYENQNACLLNKKQDKYSFIANDKPFINWMNGHCLCSIKWNRQKNNNDGLRVVVMCDKIINTKNYLCKNCLKKNKNITDTILMDKNLKYYYTDDRYKSFNNNKLCILPEEIEEHLKLGIDISEVDANMYIKKYYKDDWQNIFSIFD